jgi:flagellar basal-body rod protein FlgB
MSWSDTAVIEKLGEYLNLAAFRQTLIASNMANVDTPGYRTRDIDFQGEMSRAEDELGLEAMQPRVFEVSGLIERPDGNNVSLDRETLLLARTELQFRLAVDILRKKFQEISSAIKEGNS